MIGAVVYDVLAIQCGGTQASISYWFASFSDYPVPVFGCGFLAGHFFGKLTVPVTPAGMK